MLPTPLSKWSNIWPFYHSRSCNLGKPWVFPHLWCSLNYRVVRLGILTWFKSRWIFRRSHFIFFKIRNLWYIPCKSLERRHWTVAKLHNVQGWNDSDHFAVVARRGISHLDTAQKKRPSTWAKQNRFKTNYLFEKQHSLLTFFADSCHLCFTSVHNVFWTCLNFLRTYGALLILLLRIKIMIA